MTEFHQNWVKTVDFSLMTNFWWITVFYESTTNIAVKYGSNTEKAKDDFYLLFRSDFPYISHNLRSSNCNSFYLWVYDYDLQCTYETLMLLRFTLILVWVMFFHMIIQIFWDSEYSLSYDSPQFILTPIDKPQAQHM